MKLNTTIGIILFAAIIVFVNLIASQVFFRVDLTENNIYSLSDVSKEIVKTLPDKVVIKAFFSEDIAAPYNMNKTYTRDLLDEYRAYSKGKIDYEFINPDEDDEAKEEAMKYRIQPVQIRAIERDEMSFKNVHMGLVFLYEDKQEVIPVVQRVDDLEYQMTSIIKKLTMDEIPQVGYVTGQGEPDLTTECKQIQQALSGQYRLVPVNLPSEQGIAENIKTLVIVSPQREFDKASLAQIDQFVMYGGRLAVFLDKYSVDIQNQQSTPINSGLELLLLKYGINIQQTMVLDEQAGQIAVTRQAGFFNMQVPMAYPFIAMVTNFNEDHPITADLEAAAMIFSSPVEPAGELDGVTYTPLFETTDKSDVAQPPFDLNPMSYENAKYMNGPFELAYAMEGVFPSAKSIIAPDEGFIMTRPPKDESDPTKIVVVGDGDFVVDKYLRNQANLILFLNIIDWLTAEEGKGLISIRSREVQTRPLKEIESHGIKTFIKVLNIFLAPILVVVYGIIRWQFRRRRRKMSIALREGK